MDFGKNNNSNQYRTQKKLSKMKLTKNESYEEIIWDLLDDRKELSDETLKNIREAEEDIQAGRIISHAQLKKELGL